MILASETKEKIMNVRDYYEKRGQFVDENFVKETLTILQKEDKFQKMFEYEFVKKERIFSCLCNKWCCLF